MTRTKRGDGENPVISLLMPVHNTAPDVLESAIRSVLSQTVPDWELCICDDASTSPQTIRALERYRGVDPRVKVHRSATPLQIAGASNVAAEFATGDFVAFLDHDDTLAIDAVEQIGAEIRAHADADVLYSDEDKIEPNGAYSEPYLKPDWSPDLLLSMMYVLHLLVIRKSLFLELGGFRALYSGAQDFDLALRATARARRVVHVPRVLYHWRKVPGSAAAVIDAKPLALERAREALADFVRPGGAKVEPGLIPGSFRVRWPIAPKIPVTLLILTNARERELDGRGRVVLVENFVRSIIAKTRYREFQIVVVDDGAMRPQTRDELIALGVVIRPYAFEGEFNFSRKLNHALAFVDTESVVILNDDLEIISADWLDALLEQSLRPEIGAVGARLRFPNGRIQHAGIVLGVHRGAAHIFHHWPGDRVAYCGFSHVTRNYSAVTAAVLATRMSVVREVGGFDDGLAVDYNDVDFCLRLKAAGYRVVYTPFAELYHFEASSLVRSAPNEADEQRFLARWGAVVDADPYYHPYLPRDRVDCLLEW